MHDVKVGLDVLGVCSTFDDAEIFVKRHDYDHDGTLNLAEFTHAIAPSTKEYRHLFTSRVPIDIESVRVYLDHAFVPETRLAMRDLFSAFVHVEHVLHNLRLELIHFPHTDAFNTLDGNKDGFVTKKNIKDMLKKHFLLQISDQEAANIIRRIDQHNSSKINFTDWTNDLSC